MKKNNKEIRYDSLYNEDNFWDKISSLKTIGATFLYHIFLLWEMINEVPLTQKTAILSALAYFVLPFDAIPDFLPGGFADDAAAVITALSVMSSYINNDIKKKAKNDVHDWMDCEDSEIKSDYF